MELKIQLFADDGVSVDVAATEESATDIENVAKEATSLIEQILKILNNLLNNEGIKSVAGNTITEVVDYITPYLGEFGGVVSDLGSFLKYVISSYSLTDEELTNEFKAWGETITGSVSNIKSAFTEVASGYTTSQYIMDLSSSARTMVGEGVKMISNTGKLISSATGKSVLDTVKGIGSAAVGTVKQLLGFAKSSANGGTTAKYVSAITGSI